MAIDTSSIRYIINGEMFDAEVLNRPAKDLAELLQSELGGGYYTQAEADALFLAGSNNLSDVVDPALARSNLGVQSTAQAAASYLNISNNLSDIGDAATARTNLGVYSITQTNALFLTATNNLSDLADAATARTNLGVQSAAEAGAAYLNVSNNLSDLSDPATALSNLGGTSYGIGVFTAASAEDAATSMGAGTTGSSLFQADTAGAALSALGGLAGVVSANGYVYIPILDASGNMQRLLVQWGTIAYSASEYTVTLPVAYTTEIFGVLATRKALYETDNHTIGATVTSLSEIEVRTDLGDDTFWLTIGY